MQPLDALTLKHLAADLHTLLQGSKVNKVQQLSRTEFLLHLWGTQGRHRLYINLTPQAACCFCLNLTETWDFSLAAPLPKPTGFCMLLRKYLTAAKVLQVTTIPGERVLNITLQHYNELGHLETLVLSLELMGKYTNMLLYNDLEQVILGAAHPVTEAMSRYREVAPGLPYIPPPRPVGKQFFWELPEADFQTFLTHLAPAELSTALTRQFWGLSRSVVEAVLQHDPEPTHLYQHLLGLETGKALCPAISSEGQHYTLLRPDETWTASPSVHELVHHYFLAQLSRQSFRELQQILLHALQRQEKKRNTLEQALQPIGEADIAHTQKIGDLLFSALSTGTLPASPPPSIALEDYETQAELQVSLDPALSWVENAQRYYRRARKAKSQQALYQEQAERLTTEQAHLAELTLWVQQADTLPALRQLKAELAQEGILKESAVPDQSKTQQPPETTTGLLKLVSSEGIPLLVGRSGQANGLLIGKLLKPQDVWLHVHNMPGSHVLIKADQHPVPDQTLLEAANLTVHFSAGRHSKNVPVLYTQGRYVRKIPHSYPGHVNYREEKTVFITPDEALVQSLLLSPLHNLTDVERDESPVE